MYVANEDDNMVTVVDIASRPDAVGDPGGRGARGHRRQP